MNEKEFLQFIQQSNFFEKLGIQNVLKDEKIWKEIIEDITKDDEIILKGKELLELILKKKGYSVFQKLISFYINNPFKKMKDEYLNKFKDKYEKFK